MESENIAAIVNTVNLYATAVDTLHWSLFDGVFTADAAIDFGGPAAFDGLDDLKRGFDVIHSPFKSTQHFTSNHQVALSGDEATCLSYFRVILVRDVPNGGSQLECTGWYDDVLVRTPKGWRIRSRSSHMTGWSGNPEVLKTSPQAGVPETTDSLAAEAKAGSLGHLAALLKHQND